jgi:uncharacterized protein YydD (DUF2326 family)
MQISRIYSNRPKIFEPIEFNVGVEAPCLNVIIGEVRKPTDRKRDSHNLGKTTLIHLIDFLMLKGVSTEFFIVKRKERFEDFVFFLEIALNAGGFATIRRSVAEPSEIWMTRHADRGKDFSGAPEDAWDHRALGLDAARELLDAWLDLRILKPYNYRKAITYFLRSQGDWSDELELRKFEQGKDSAWKPFVVHLFGFNNNAFVRKYELDEQIDVANQKLRQQQSEVQFKDDEFPALMAEISALRQEVDGIAIQLDAFQFDAEERRLMEELVNVIEEEISSINGELYNVRYDIRQINAALEHQDKFDLQEITEIFEETKLHFPDALKRKYEELIAFNKKVTHERDVALRSRRRELEARAEELQARRGALDEDRQRSLSTLRTTDTFAKFKELQKLLGERRAQLIYKDEQRKKLELVADTARQVRELERDRGRVVDELKATLNKQTPILEKFRMIFNQYCQSVLDHRVLFYFELNKNNNLTYKIELEEKGNIGKPSSQSDGTSYKKLICALFDLALLKVYEDAPFFHFVYHDGVLEALDNRKKEALLRIVREQSAKGKTQYIMTLIDADVPRNAAGKRHSFSGDEVILRLHDEGDEGRLFKMPEF